jgi:trimethylamine--corrinoid protein Co-methyltransferase
MDNASALSMLTGGQLNRICDAAFEVLERTGVRFADPRILDEFAARGARLDSERGRVHFPRSLVEWVLDAVARTFALYSRDGDPVEIGRPHVRFSNSTYDVWVLDYETGQRHRSTLAHVEQFVRLGDALDNIDILGAQVVPQDVPEPLRQIKAAEALLKYTSKPFVMNLLNVDEGETVLAMVEAASGGTLREKPRLFVLFCPDSPLRYEACVTDVMRLAVGRGVPVGIGPCPVLGASAPITLAGALVQTIAEALAGLAFAKLLDEKCLVYLGTTPFAMAPQGNLLMAAPECYLISAGFAQVCRHLGIPNSFSSTHTDSKIPTMQTGYEKAMGLTLAILSGSPLVQVPAILDDGATTSLQQLVIEAEMVGAARRLLQGISVCDETMAVDVIHEGAASGNLVAHDHTVAHLRSEFWRPDLLYRGTCEQLDLEARTVEKNAVERVRHLLATHSSTPLAADAEREIHRIVERAAKRAGVPRQH